jgi:hypothetical protein
VFRLCAQNHVSTICSFAVAFLQDTLTTMRAFRPILAAATFPCDSVHSRTRPMGSDILNNSGIVPKVSVLNLLRRSKRRTCRLTTFRPLSLSCCLGWLVSFSSRCCTCPGASEGPGCYPCQGSRCCACPLSRQGPRCCSHDVRSPLPELPLATLLLRIDL